ncbi:transcription repressor OFP4-like [Vigna unguiculata]|uniref:transcription repressor OFP4-like n=1 Tax=Vigna unguiculata TaxID=3917 RepID=UPI001015EAD1|nr:transcription repressor OFP4-like [Vigna unguiculata]
MCSKKRKRFMRALFKTNGGCGCRNPKSYEVLQLSIHQNTTNPTTSGDNDNNVFSEVHTNHENPNNDNMRKPNSKLIDTVAVEKDSKDPHKDFRESMLQMIFQRQIFTKTDLQDLLECFLRLNAADNYQVIVQAFMEICHETFPKKNINDADANAASFNNKI